MMSVHTATLRCTQILCTASLCHANSLHCFFVPLVPLSCSICGCACLLETQKGRDGEFVVQECSIGKPGKQLWR